MSKWLREADQVSVKNLYVEHKSCQKVSDLTGFSLLTVRNIAKKFGVYENELLKSMVPKAELEIMKTLYLSGLSSREISKEINRTPECVIRNLHKNNVRVRTYAEASRKYFYNHQFFQNPENWSEKQAYWLGWLYSDGSLGKKCVSIRLAEEDKSVLESLKDLINYDGPLIFLKRPPESIFGKEAKQYQHRFALNISQPEFVDQIFKLKIKSDFPFYLRADLWPHFIRALYEGDGTFSFCKKYNKFETNLLAEEPVLSKIKDIFLSLGLSSHIFETGFNNGVKVLRLSGCEKGLSLFNFLYKDCNNYLKRKLNAFKELKKYKSNRHFVYPSSKIAWINFANNPLLS